MKDAAEGVPEAIKALEWYGHLCGLGEPNEPMPAFIKWRTVDAAYELIRVREFVSDNGRFRGFEAYSLTGQDFGFFPTYEIHLYEEERNLWVILEVPLLFVSSIAGMHIPPDVNNMRAWGRRAYALLQSDFEGGQHADIRTRVEKLRQAAKSIR